MENNTVAYPPAEFLRWLHRRRGSVVTAHSWPHSFAYLMGPAANEFVFANDRLFSMKPAMDALIPVDGPTSVIVSDGTEHARRRSLLRPALHTREISGYVQTMREEADAAIAAVPTGATFDGYALFRAAIRRANLRVLFGERIASCAEQIGADLQPALDLIDRLPHLVQAHRRLRSPAWRRAMRSLGRLDSFVYAEMDRVRAPSSPAQTQVLSALVHGRDKEGSRLSDQEVRDQIVTLIAAGYETTSASMGWALYALGSHPELMNQAREEVLSVTAGGPTTDEDISDLELLGAIVKESLRLYPPAVFLARSVVGEFEFEGRTVVPGTIVMLSPYVTHRSEDVYEAPLEFRPQRWLVGAKRPPSEFITFGGGAHRCLGETLAMTELTVMLARLLSKGGWQLEEQRVRATSFAAMRPRDGIRLRLT